VLFGGGASGTDTDINIINTVDIYNATSGIWTTASLSVARAGVAAVSVKDLVLFGGGFSNLTYYYSSDTLTVEPSNAVDIFNATSGAWTTASLSIARFELAAASVKDLVLFGGGTSNGTNYYNIVDIYNATSGVWTTASLSVARYFLAAASVKDLVLFGGGLNYNSSNTVDIFTPYCTSNAECDDGIFCNGIETCQGGSCFSSGNPCLSGATCKNTCNENAKTCSVRCESSKAAIIVGVTLGVVVVALLVLVGVVLYYLRRYRSGYTKLN
jgi:hypothetical protein